MRYTKLGDTDLIVSVLGFGCMRLPEKDGAVVRELSTPLLRRAVELGINYFDTAIDYCNGDSQAAVGEALEGVREQVILSTKNHHHGAKKGEWRRYLEESLKLLRTEYIDIYSHHGISWQIYKKYLDPENGGLTREMMRAREEGLIRHIGFSFHDAAENLIKLIDTGNYEIVTVQYNLLDQRNKDAILYAEDKGIGVVIMGPVGGGRLGLPSETISELVGDEVASTPEAALRFVWGTPGVDISLSGMQDLGMLEENVRIAENCEPFSEHAIAKLNAMVAERKKKSGLYCTGCRYCLPECPNSIAIPENLDLLNLAAIYDLHDTARERYQQLKGKAADCIECGRCLAACPQGIDIPRQLRKAAMMFDEDAGTVQVEAVIDELSPEGRFSLDVKVFNFSYDQKDVSILLRPGVSIAVKPDFFDIHGMAGFARLTRKVDGSFEPQSQQVALSVEGRCGGITTIIEINYGFFFACKGLSYDWKSGKWIEFHPAERDFCGLTETVDRHGVRFKLSYDDKDLLLLADVKDDFLFPTVRKTHDGVSGDCLELVIDGQRDVANENRGHGEGACHILLYPGTPGKAPPFYRAPRTDMGIRLSAKKTESGYRLSALIPFRSFVAGDIPPKKIGFDLGCKTANSNGNRIGSFSWTGNRDIMPDIPGLNEIWMV